MTDFKFPRIGIGVMILNDNNEVLLGLRKSSHGSGEWSFPGGHLEFGEKMFECAKREVKEEVGLDLNEFEIISVADEMRYVESDGKHYVNIGIKATYNNGEVKNMEPHKCERWEWFSLDVLPENLFEGTGLTLEYYLKNSIK